MYIYKYQVRTIKYYSIYFETNVENEIVVK